MQMWMKRRYELQTAQGNQQTRRQRGFTLIEIMVVIAILGILAALIVPKIMSRPDEARRVAAKADIGSVMQSLNLYRLDNGRYPTQEQGLRALVEKPTVEPIPNNWKGGGYMDRVPPNPAAGIHAAGMVVDLHRIGDVERLAGRQIIEGEVGGRERGVNGAAARARGFGDAVDVEERHQLGRPEEPRQETGRRSGRGRGDHGGRLTRIVEIGIGKTESDVGYVRRERKGMASLLGH